MLKLKRIGVLSLARIASIFLALYGFLTGLIISIMLLISPANILEKIRFTNSELMMLNQLGPWIIILLPLMYLIIFAVAGFILGVVVSFVYNLIARKTGGIEVELSK